MLGKKRRVKTGCLTCRQRRVKCDEKKPTCGRCQAANVYCDGYDSQRHVESRTQSLADDSVLAKPASAPSKYHSAFIKYRADGLPLVGCPDNPAYSERPPHQRARDVLAHQQYTFRTAPLLFKEEHIYYWKDHILQIACYYEYVYDIVLALGTVHRASLLLSQPYERWKGLDTKVIALQMYGDALQQLSAEFRNGKRCMDIQVGVLLLLVYFECFIGNPVSAFRHLRAAKYYFAAAESELRQQNSTAMEPLSSCIAQLELVVAAFIPLPNISLLGQVTGDISYITEQKGNYEMSQGLELHRIIAAYPDVTISVITPLNGNITRLDSLQVNTFQTQLRRWRDASDQLFQDCDEEPIVPSVPDSSWASLDELPIPPRAQYFSSVETAITVALYNCFMAHTMWLLSITTNTSHPCEISAYLYAYQNLRIAEGLLSSKAERNPNEDRYFPCEALNIGLSLILYLTVQCCYGPAWQQWIVDKLRYISQEGIFNSEAFATCLDMLKSYQHTQKPNILGDKGNAWLSKSPLGPPASRIIPTLLPDPDGKQFTGYYMKIVPQNRSLPSMPTSSLQVVGRASWRVEDSDSSEQKRSVDLQTSHLDLMSLSDLSAEIKILSNRWEALFQTPACQMNRGMDDYINECTFPTRPKTTTNT